MSRNGRKFAQHVVTSGGIKKPPVLARNYASGLSAPLVLTNATAQSVPWASIQSGAPAGPSVPITPKTTGVVRVSGSLDVFSTSLENTVLVTLEPAGIVVSVGTILASVAGDAGTLALLQIPFLFDLTLTVGVTTDIQILVQLGAAASGGNIELLTTGPLSSGLPATAVELQEVILATG